MDWIVYISITLLTAVIMELVAWATHKYVMHGFLWYLHKDHHQKEPGFFEKNDAFFLIFAIPSWLCIMLGMMAKNYMVVSIGAGIAVYGAAYFLVHDVIIHQRFKWFTRSNNVYIKTIRWAHKMHHKSLIKQRGESFGMLWVAKKYYDKVRSDKNFKIQKVQYAPELDD
jgi:beta-carotene 3-hydroxylase